MRLKPVNNFGLSRELGRRIAALQKPVAARIVVPPTMKWWFWQEFGVATRRRAVVQYGVPGPGQGYIIRPITKKLLSFPDAGVGYALEEDPTKIGNVVAERIPASDADIGISHPGYEPRFMIRSILPDIQRVSGTGMVESMLTSNYNHAQMKADLIHKTMPQVVNLIAHSFSEKLNNYDRADGRLKGEDAGEAFKREASIVDTSVSKDKE